MEEQLAGLGLIAALGLGILLGLRHSLDPDHVVAVSTIVSEYRNPLRSFWVGVSWGLGHTTTLFIIGVIIIALQLRFPPRLALGLEFLVGIMLVAMGAQVIYNFRKKRVHQHAHAHEEDEHQHPHVSQEEQHQHFHFHPGETEGAKNPRHVEEHRGVGKPFFRTKSYLVGTVHGVAGSAALTLLVLASIKDPWMGLAYILVFGLGSVLSMGAATIIISVPFSLSARSLPAVNRVVQIGIGGISILFGLFLMYEIAFVGRLF
ncbi:MAG: urease accessory protein UreH [Dehalococcoidia bacterium]|nr:urease accessory protein UreH [Dehalococcoidia bacterium]MSQ16834.1 urease accessory protein UreH [Dehalococcoidia bacterium]